MRPAKERLYYRSLQQLDNCPQLGLKWRGGDEEKSQALRRWCCFLFFFPLKKTRWKKVGRTCTQVVTALRQQLAGQRAAAAVVLVCELVV